MRICLVMLVNLCLLGQSTFEGRPAIILSSGVMDVAVLPTGATIASVTLKGDAERLNPLWNPKNPGSGFGHFICLDGFGPVSPEERSAGMEFHGEAVRQAFEIRSQDKRDGVEALTLAAKLPLVQEQLTRTFRIAEGESVIQVRSRLESLVGFDRPISWAEHATIGAPFLEAAVTAVDLPAEKSKTRPYAEREGVLPHRLAPDKEFEWPMAPLKDGMLVDIRKSPASPNSGDHTTSLLVQSREQAFVTALHPGKRLLVGWLFRRGDFPWLQNWEYYPNDGKLARGLEFSTQPFDVSRRDAVAMNPMFASPTFRWLPAKSIIETSFLIFYTRVPEGFTRVRDVRLEGNKLVIGDQSGKEISLPASLGL